MCYACYKAHLQLIHENTTISNDTSLLANIDKLQQSLPRTANMTTIDAVKEYAMIRTTILVGETILRQEALLLPAVRNYYAQTAYQCIQASTQLTQSRPPKSLVTARYILSHLSMTLKQHLSYMCQLKKYGTLLYRKNGNIHALTCSLHNVQYTDCESDSTAGDLTTANDEDQREQILENLDALIHKEAKAFIASDTQVPFQFDTIDIESLIAQINPKLWSAVKTLTQTSQHNKSAEDEEASLDMHEQRI